MLHPHTELRSVTPAEVASWDAIHPGLLRKYGYQDGRGDTICERVAVEALLDAGQPRPSGGIHQFAATG